MSRETSAEQVSVLDDRAVVEGLDPHGLLGRIESLPEQCAQAWAEAQSMNVPAAYGDAREAVVLGMGGSAIAGDIVRALGGRKPVIVVRGYEPPAFVGSDTLVVACSHSGSTEETLSAFEQALGSGATCAAVTAGGRLRELAEAHGAKVFAYTYDGEPRSALGHQLMRLLRLCEGAGVLEAEEAVEEAVALLRRERSRLAFEVPVERNAAKQIAERLHEKLPVIVGAAALTEAAHRWKTQLNENSECWAAYEELPELDHNAIVGFGLPAEVAAQAHVVFLWHPSLHERVLLRYDATADELSNAGVSHERVEVAGSSALAQVLSAVYLGDLASYYLALLYGVEPSPVRQIDRLKVRLSRGP